MRGEWVTYHRGKTAVNGSLTGHGREEDADEHGERCGDVGHDLVVRPHAQVLGGHRAAVLSDVVVLKRVARVEIFCTDRGKGWGWGTGCQV